METKIITPQNEPRPGGFPPRSQPKPQTEPKPEKSKPAEKEGDKK